MPDPYDLSVVVGDTLRWTSTFVDSSGNSYNLTGATLSMQVRKGYYPSALVVSYTLGVTAGSGLTYPNGLSGGISTTATGGVAYLCIGSTYTNQFPAYTNVFYDLQAVGPIKNDTITLAKGRITPLPNVTN